MKFNRSKHEANKIQRDLEFEALRELNRRLRESTLDRRQLETAIGVRRGTVSLGSWAVNDNRSTEELEADLAKLCETHRQLEAAQLSLQARVENRCRLIDQCEQFIRRVDRDAARVIEPPGFRGKASLQHGPSATATRQALQLGDVPGGNPAAESAEQRWGMKG